MENGLDDTLSATSTPVTTSDCSSGGVITGVRVAGIIKKNLRRNQDRDYQKVSLADRIKSFRENRDLSGENSRWTSVSHASSDLHSLVSEYRDVLSHESKLSAAVLKSIFDARHTNQHINTSYSGSPSTASRASPSTASRTSPSTVSYTRVLKDSFGSVGRLTTSLNSGHASRRRIFQDSDGSRSHDRSPAISRHTQRRRMHREYPVQYQGGHKTEIFEDFRNGVTSSPKGVLLPELIGSDVIGVTQATSRSTKEDVIFPRVETTSSTINSASHMQGAAVDSLMSLTKSRNSLPTEYPHVRTHDNESHLYNSTISGQRCTSHPEVHGQTSRCSENSEGKHSVHTGPSLCTQSVSTVVSPISRTGGLHRKPKNRYTETIQREFTRRRYQSPSFLLNHLLDVADDSYEKVLSEFSSRTSTRSVATQTPGEDKGAETHSITGLLKHYRNMNGQCRQGTETGIIKDNETYTGQSNAPVLESTPSVSSNLLRKRRQLSKNSNNRTYSFVNFSLTRSLSLPNMTKCSSQNTVHLRKNYTEVDIETFMNETNVTMKTWKAMCGGFTFPSISQTNKSYNRSRDIVPITRTTLRARQMYLRSHSCGDIMKADDKLMDTPAVPRLIGLYKDLGSFSCFSSDDDALQMMLRERNSQILDVKVTWGSNEHEDILILYKDPDMISYVFKDNKDSNKSRRQKEFIYLDDVPIRKINAGQASDKDAQRFMNIPVQKGCKLSTSRLPQIYRANQSFVPKRMCSDLYKQTRYHFVPWK